MFSELGARHIAEGSVFASHEQLGTLAGIRLRKDFFDLPEDKQTLTLLHEAIHVALFAGECQDWYKRAGLWRENSAITRSNSIRTRIESLLAARRGP